MDFIVSIIATDQSLHEYIDLAGPKDTAKATALRRFTQEHPHKTVAEVLAMPMADYYYYHQCRDNTGRGFCDYCGGVIKGSPLWLDINGAR